MMSDNFNEELARKTAFEYSLLIGGFIDCMIILKAFEERECFLDDYLKDCLYDCIRDYLHDLERIDEKK